MNNSKLKSQNTSPKPNPHHPPDWHSIRQRNRERHVTANFITIVMILLTILALVWIAYQLNNPISINLSRFLHH